MSQRVHLNSFFFSWTPLWIIEIVLYHSLPHKHFSHLNAFSFSWTDGLCVFNYTFSKKRSQSSHLNCFFFSWIPYMCVSCPAKPLFVEKLAKQILYWCDFFPSWPDLMLLFVKISQHKVHIRMTSFSHNRLKLLFMIDSSTAFFSKVCITDFTF